MASGKKNYFRHSFFAHNDDFIINLIDKLGYQGYFLWFTLLEVCGEIASDSYPETFKIHNSRLLRSLRCRQDKLDSFLTLAELQSRLSWERVENNHHIQIHNFRKYLGKYENLNDPKSPNKRKEKEKKRNNENALTVASKPALVFTSPLNALFEDMPEIHAWLSTGDQKTHLDLLKTFDDGFLKESILSAFNWKVENKKKRLAGSYIKAWIERSKKKVYKPGMSPDDIRLRKFFTDQGIEPDRLIS